ncbi:hypothetical protein [Geminocystis sp. NIES-3709]|uniref:hypothetical protein n=1 Tax=Geminocystis sp. NIES-3709 TaxID=1617448 RepID=UPI0005FC3B73|nr:hypothetical protein [Geminocystis sp. NIES-3709]BAQ65877.1 hypothetical protein GM3709_2642 [Geminocystis sp. NIES-3709]
MKKNSIETTHIFTSCTNNYLPKARVLGKTLKKFHPNIKFHLVLSDIIHHSINLENEPFDSIITLEELPIPNLKQWIFKHSLVEMCTAVKGLGFLEIIKRYNCDNVIFFDPDIAIFYPLDELLDNFNQNDILLTPHQLNPENLKDAVIDNEICFLKYGTFNLGFLGVKNSEEGIKFLHWWSSRCLNFCYDDPSRGLYTDQRWIDLVPSFFSDITILKHPGYNVANWNLTNRHVTGDISNKIFVENQPLCFYHFSGSQGIMPQKYDLINPSIESLLKWYEDECATMGEKEFSKISCFYDYFDNGELIKKEERLLYRERIDLQQNYPNPFDTKNSEDCYYNWYRNYENEKQKIESEKNNRLYALEWHFEDKSKQINDLQQQLDEKNNRLYALEWHFEDKTKQLNEKNDRLYALEWHFEDKSKQIHDLQQQLDEKTYKIHNLQEQLDKILGLIEEIESSKFWKLRQRWFTFRKIFTLKKN